MAKFNDEFFGDELDQCSDFDKLDGIFRELDLSKAVYEIKHHRKFCGHQD